MTKLVSVLFASFLFYSRSLNAQGKYAGEFKYLIGKKYTTQDSIKAFKKYPLHEGSVISDVNDLDVMMLDMYRKGTTAVVVFGSKTDSPREEYQVIDILEIKNIPRGYEINTTTCQEGETEGQVLIVLVKTTQTEYAGPVKKAWRCDRDKLRFEWMNTKLIKCLNEGGD